MWNWIKQLFAPRVYTVNQLVEQCGGSLVKLQFLISDAVKYQKDDSGEMDFTKAEVVLKRKHGDCDCFCRVWGACFDLMGIKYHIYACLRDDGKNHALNLFKYRNKWCYTSNQYFISTNCTTKEETLSYAFPADRYEIVV